MREIASPLSGPFTTFGQTPIDIYKVGAYRPELAYSFYNEYYRRGRQPVNFLDAITHTRNGNATMTGDYGPELVTNGSFDTDLTGWTATAGTIAFLSGKMEVTTGAGNSNGHQAITCVVGKTYQVTAQVIPVTSSAGMGVGTASGTADIVFEGYSSSTRTATITFTATQTTHYIQGWVFKSAGGETAKFDNISVREVPKIQWAPHNLALNSATPATQSITVVSGVDYTVECTGVSIALSGAGTGTVTEGNPVEITASTTTLTLTVTGSSGTMWAYRSDLGGMADNPDQPASLASYVPTTSSAVYLPRRGHHVYNGSQWVNKGLLHESEARTQLLHTTDALVTQSHTVTAVPHTLHFTGTGTVTLLGVSTAGPLVGTGTGENNRVSLTFTPTAGTLILTVSGTVSDAQLEVGPTPSSYIPNLASSGSVTRAAETITIPAANLPWPSPVYVTNEELVTNGTFDTDTSGWTTYNATLTWSDGTALYTDGGASDYFSQYISTLELGKLYYIDLGNDDVESVSIESGDTTSSGTLAGAYLVVNGRYAQFIAPANGCTIKIHHNGASSKVFDNISVKEINPLALSIQMKGEVTYADTGEAVDTTATTGTVNFYHMKSDANNYVAVLLDTEGANVGAIRFTQEYNSVYDVVITSADTYSPDINVPFNISSRHGSTFINGAIDGVALTANTTPVALPDLENTDLDLAYDFMGTISLFRIWANDLGDTGIAEASEPSTQATLFLSFDGSNNSYIDFDWNE